MNPKTFIITVIQHDTTYRYFTTTTRVKALFSWHENRRTWDVRSPVVRLSAAADQETLRQWTPVRRSPHSVPSYVKLSHIYIYSYVYIYIHIFSSYILYSLGTWHESTNRLESNPFLKSLRHKPFRLEREEREEREERVAVGVGFKPSNSGTRFCGGGPRTLHAELPEELPEPSGPGLESSLPGLDFDFHKSTTKAGSFPKYCRRVCSRGVKKTFLLSSKSSMPLPRLA